MIICIKIFFVWCLQRILNLKEPDFTLKSFSPQLGLSADYQRLVSAENCWSGSKGLQATSMVFVFMGSAAPCQKLRMLQEIEFFEQSFSQNRDLWDFLNHMLK